MAGAAPGVWCVMAAVLVAAGGVCAQENGAPGADMAHADAARDEDVLLRPENDHDWTLRVEPGIWLVSPSGQVRLPGASDDRVRVETMNLDTPEVRPAGEIHLQADRWRLSFFGSQYDQETDFVAEEGFTIGDVAIDVGDTADVEFDFTVVEALAGYRVWEHDFDACSEDLSRTIDADLRVFLVGGLRAYDLGFDVREIGAGGVEVSRSATDQFFAEPVIGVRSEMDLWRDFTVDLQLSGGGYFDSDRSSASFDIVVGFQWRPHPNVGVQIGWRQVSYWLSDGDGEDEFEYNGRMAGIQGGLVIRF